MFKYDPHECVFDPHECVLIDKVYGHLANEHRSAMAERVNFGPGRAMI
jgi:hypothetical protein